MNSDAKAIEFQTHRIFLEGLAYRMLGSVAEAQDVVQNTYLRWSGADTVSIRSPKAWLTKTCTRVAMDELKSARAQREEYHGPWLPEPYLEDDSKNPDDQAQIDNSVSVALIVALEKLSPAERATFLLHDVFGYSFDEIAEILGKSGAACLKLASRARSSVRADRPKFEANPEDHKRLLESFFTAARSGDLDGLKSLLSESVSLHSDGGGKVIAVPKIISGADVVALFFTRIAANEQRSGNDYRAAPHWYNGAPGLILYENGIPTTAFSLKIEEGRIETIFALRNPDKLAQLD
ncbi:MAG: RNA polymerase sigma factor SigJ [Opitutales bacterium]|nr:RNA polymerase sigma factor SigJ [Opitutales bacterium]